MYFNKIKLIILILISSTIGIVLALLSRIHSVPYYIIVNCQSNEKAECQLFYDIGKGFIERHSIKKFVAESNVSSEILFRLPAKKINNLRFDPLDREGSIHIESFTLRGKQLQGESYKILHEFNLNDFKAIQQVDLKFNDLGNLVATTQKGGNDPVIDLSLSEPLDHWKLQDFCDDEWVKKSLFFIFLFTPIALSLSFVRNIKEPKAEKINFSFNDKFHSLAKGESFKAAPENCYQDTNEQNLRFIIDKIQSGTHWKVAIKEKFQNENPWLYEIITSPKRTKFIDECIKPNNLSVLDIGAGWGQFSRPIAASNQVCALEPTSERLDFIKAVADQDNLSKNISFIGADYMEIKFENKFDLILSIGVMEWVGTYREDKPPGLIQQEFLQKIKDELKEGGRLLIGIENRMGLKYLLGNRDDHTGIADISCYHQALAERLFKEETGRELRCFTYSMEEYRTMLLEAGFKNIAFHAAFPDYKLPQVILPANNSDSVNQFFMSGQFVEEHDGCEGYKISEQEKFKSHYVSLAQAGIAQHFAPSFFIECS